MTDVKVIRPLGHLLSAGLPSGGPRPASVPRKAVPDGDGKDDKKELSTDASAPSPPSSLRDQLVKELLSGTAQETNRFYSGTTGVDDGAALTDYQTVNVTTSTGGTHSLNAILQGTAASQRLGDSIRCRRLRFRCHIRPAIIGAQVSTGGVPGTVKYSNAVRIILFVDRMPPIGTPVYQDAGSWGTGATFPTSPQALFTNPRATYQSATTPQPGFIQVAVRNPQTIKRYDVFYDRIHNPSAKYNSALQVEGGGAYAYSVNSEYIEHDVDLGGMIIQWYDQNSSSAVFANNLVFMIVADAPDVAPVSYVWMSELEFENVA